MAWAFQTLCARAAEGPQALAACLQAVAACPAARFRPCHLLAVPAVAAALCLIPACPAQPLVPACSKKIRGPAPLSLALAHCDVNDDIVTFTDWTETDFRTGERMDCCNERGRNC